MTVFCTFFKLDRGVAMTAFVRFFSLPFALLVTFTSVATPDECELLCDQHAEQVLVNCLEKGGGEGHCLEQSQAARRECIEGECSEPPSCADLCEGHAHEVFVICLEEGGGEDRCWDEREAAFSRCRERECDEPPPPDPTCEEICEARGDEVFGACLEDGGGEDHCAARRREAVGGCLDGECREASEVNILFRLDGGEARAGTSVRVPFFIVVDRPSQGFSFSVDFDEGVLQALSVTRLWERPDGTPYDFETYEINNENANLGSAGVDEGFIVGAAIISLIDTDNVLPPSEEVKVLEFELRVSQAAPKGETELQFVDGGQGSGGPVRNRLIASGVAITPESAGSFIFVNALISIVPDATPFVRGDSNGDEFVNLTDGIHVLEYLFRSAEAPPCEDAADANDSGRLDLSDGVTIFQDLFGGNASFAAPHNCGPDPTEDKLATCLLPEEHPCRPRP